MNDIVGAVYVEIAVEVELQLGWQLGLMLSVLRRVCCFLRSSMRGMVLVGTGMTFVETSIIIIIMALTEDD